MDAQLDLNDIQGNILKTYARKEYIFARYIFFSIKDGVKGRKFVSAITEIVTNAAPWGDDNNPKPDTTTNIAFTYHGLKKLELPEESLHSFPEDFSMGMRERSSILGDTGVSSSDHWDPVWNNGDKKVDIWVSINGLSKEVIERRYDKIISLCGASGGVNLLTGHRGEGGAEDLAYQDASALFNKNGEPTAKEHFGYDDGISNPFFKGTQSNPAFVLGGGKPTTKDPATLGGWEPLETGEFIMGYRDEAKEYPEAPLPRLLSYNGTFMVYRKLHENVGSFNTYTKELAGSMGEDGVERVAAKFAGRWRNGVPITTFPTYQEAIQYKKDLAEAKEKFEKADGIISKNLAKLKYYKLLAKMVGFDYNKDIEGGRCPVGAHMRRANPRGALQFGKKGAFNTPGALVNRRRLLRRGLPYGTSQENTDQDDGNHGIIFMALGASINRQFEFVQQQWINYGNDFKLANDKDPILGNHTTDHKGHSDGKMVFEAENDGDESPRFCCNIPRFVEVRGGGYFFVPSLTALRLIGAGIIDPT